MDNLLCDVTVKWLIRQEEEEDDDWDLVGGVMLLSCMN